MNTNNNKIYETEYMLQSCIQETSLEDEKYIYFQLCNGRKTGKANCHDGVTFLKREFGIYDFE